MAPSYNQQIIVHSSAKYCQNLQWWIQAGHTSPPPPPLQPPISMKYCFSSSFMYEWFKNQAQIA